MCPDLEADVREEVKEDEQKMERFDLRLLLLLLQGYTLLPGGQHFVEGVDADSRSGQTTVRKDIMTVATSEAPPPSKATDIRSLGFLHALDAVDPLVLFLGCRGRDAVHHVVPFHHPAISLCLTCFYQLTAVVGNVELETVLGC